MLKGEKIDPYFSERLASAKAHRVVGQIERPAYNRPEAESNREIPHPVIEGAIDEVGWIKEAVDNIIDADQKGWIKIERLKGDRVRIEFMPIETPPSELGQVAEVDAIKKNISRRGAVYGAEGSDQLTYLQTVDFAVEGYMDDEREGQRYGRLFIDIETLRQKRNVYLDPESLHITDYEYGYSFCVQGGIPWEAIQRVDIIQARKIARNSARIDTGDWPASKEAAESEMNLQTDRLKKYLAARG